MEKRFTTISQCLVLVGFALIAMSSSSMSSMNSQEVKDAFDRGWEFGSSLRSDATLDIQYLDVDSISLTQPDVAQNH